MKEVLWNLEKEKVKKKVKLRKSSFLVKLHVLKMNSFTYDCQDFCYDLE